MLKCEFCQVKYEKSRNMKHRHKDFCSRKCVEDYIDADSHVNGLYLPGTGEDNPNTQFVGNPDRDLFDWAYQGSRI